MKKVLIIFFSLGLAAAVVGIYFYYKPVKNLANITPDITVPTSDELEAILTEILQNPDEYVGKIIEFQGVVNEINISQTGGGYLLMEVESPKVIINAQLDHRVNESTLQSGAVCRVRAEFTGMEEDLIDPDFYILYFKQTALINFN